MLLFSYTVEYTVQYESEARKTPFNIVAPSRQYADIALREHFSTLGTGDFSFKGPVVTNIHRIINISGE